MTSRSIIISEDTLIRWKEIVDRYWFTDADGESYNNNAAIALSEEMNKLILNKGGVFDAS